MSEIHLWEIDLNLLVVLEVLLEERSVTRAAARLHRTQSAISHALSRLRGVFDDELLVRDGRQMRPTARAEELAESLPRVLDLLRSTLSQTAAFDPKTADRTFRLAAPDFVAAALPQLLVTLQSEAPGVQVELVRVDRGAIRDVAEGRYDGLIAPARVVGEGLRATMLGASTWRVFGRQGHPAFAAWSRSSWLAWPHLLVRTGQGRSSVEDALGGDTRTLGAIVPSFGMAPAVLERTEMLLTVPEVALSGMVERFSLTHRPVPVALPPLRLALHRSATMGGEPGVAWFLGHVQCAMRQVLSATSTPRSPTA